MPHLSPEARMNDAVSRSLNPYDAISKSLPIIKGWTIVWIVAYHLMGNTKGYFNPEEAIAALSTGNLKNIIETGLELFISAGSAGVNVFLIASGFGLTASWWQKYGRHGVDAIPLSDFWRKRVFRIFPHFWTAVAIATILYLINPDWAPFGQDIWKAGGFSPILALLSTVSTLRNFSLDNYYFLNGAWWYVGLCVQLYLIFPFLIRFGCRWGWAQLLIVSLLFSLTYRTVFFLSPILFSTESFWTIIPLAFFPSRLFEFVFGIFLAMTFLKPNHQTSATNSQQTERYRNLLQSLWTKPQFVPLCFCLFLIGFSFKWLAYPALNIFEDALMGIGLFCGLVGLSQVKFLKLKRLSKITGKYSYGIYLTHMNVYLILWPVAALWVPSYWLRFAVVIIACCGIGIGFDVGFTACRRAITAPFQQQKTV
ncbi:MAG: acyltransferase [Cyanobacteria bacterium J06650_10]